MSATWSPRPPVALALAAEAGPLGIRVLIVEPGVFRTGFFGSALRSSAAIADYDGTAGGTRAWLAAVHGTQPGDPDEPAQAVLAALDLPGPPLRLALGEDAVSAIRAKITAVSDDLARTAALSRGTDFSGGRHALTRDRTPDVRPGNLLPDGSAAPA